MWITKTTKQYTNNLPHDMTSSNAVVSCTFSGASSRISATTMSGNTCVPSPPCPSLASTVSSSLFARCVVGPALWNRIGLNKKSIKFLAHQNKKKKSEQRQHSRLQIREGLTPRDTHNTTTQKSGQRVKHCAIWWHWKATIGERERFQLYPGEFRPTKHMNLANLDKLIETQTQTTRSANKRWKNLEGANPMKSWQAKTNDKFCPSTLSVA